MQDVFNQTTRSLAAWLDCWTVRNYEPALLGEGQITFTNRSVQAMRGDAAKEEALFGTRIRETAEAAKRLFGRIG
jgi:hypothetical protein